jgi:hypothetical protein
MARRQKSTGLHNTSRKAKKLAPKTTKKRSTDPVLDEIVLHLHELCDLGLALHKVLHGSNGTEPGKHILDERTSWAWSAEVCSAFAQNTKNVRDAIHDHDPGHPPYPDPLWPDPVAAPKTSEDVLKQEILKWMRLESQLFNAMMSFYGIKPPVPKVDHEIHDILYKLSVNGGDFIDAENNGQYKGIIGKVPTPPPPIQPSPKPIIDSLQDLEQRLHLLVQCHMQIATFIPQHLDKMVVRKRLLIFMK